MIRPVITSQNPVTLVGGGAATAQDLTKALELAPTLVAADGGAVLAMEAGHVPDAVIGDFDSIPEDMRANIPSERLHQIAEQDSTDFEKVLARVAAPLCVAVGFTGARIDHELAGLHALLRFSQVPCVVIAEHEVIFHCPRHIAIDLSAGETVSLFPLLQMRGGSTGLRWPIDGLDMAPGRQIGTSNAAIGGMVQLNMEGPGMIALLPRARLSDVIQSLRVAAPWPSPQPVP